MREANFSIPSANKASVGITPALYDRRALDCTSTLPLISSLNNLAYLTTSSARIRDILTVDGGVERLVCVLKEGRSKDPMDSWKWNLAFQCIFNIGVRGSEAVRTRVVEADVVPVVATILDNYIQAIERMRKKADEEARLNALKATRQPRLDRYQKRPQPQPPPPIDTQDHIMPDAIQQSQSAPALLDASAALSPSASPSPSRPLLLVRDPGSPVPPAERPDFRPVQPTNLLPSMLETPQNLLSSQPASPATPSATLPGSPSATPDPASTRPRRRPSIRHQLSISGTTWDEEQAEDGVQETLGGADMSPDPMLALDNDIVMRDITEDETTSIALTAPVLNVPTDAAEDAESINTPIQPQLAPPPVVELSHASLRPALAAYSVPAPLLEVLPRDEDIVMSLQLLAYVSKYCNLRSYFQASRLVPRLKITAELKLLDVADDASVAAFSGPTAEELHEAWDNEFVQEPAFNIFPLIERFTVRSTSAGSRSSGMFPSTPQQSETMQYWAGVVMRNLCRKDEARGGIRQCAYWKCGKWETYTRQFAKCRRCRRTKYCSKECQKGAWTSHRFWCVSADDGQESTRGGSHHAHQHHHHHHQHSHHHHHAGSSGHGRAHSHGPPQQRDAIATDATAGAARAVSDNDMSH